MNIHVNDPVAIDAPCTASASSARNNAHKISATWVTATTPKNLSKSYWLDGGALQKASGGHIQDGIPEVVHLRGAAELAELLKSLTPQNAMLWGVPINRDAKRITTKANLERKRAAGVDGVVSRTHDCFEWADGPGVMMLDIDFDDTAPPMLRDDVLQRLERACPALKGAAKVWAASSSSHISNADTGADLTGLRGQRVYVLVQDAKDIPRAGDVLASRLWLAGGGYIKISRAGSMMQRCLIDTTVWQPERLDFAGGANLKAPLFDSRPDPVVFDGALFDTHAALPSLSDEEQKELATKVEAAKRKAEPLALLRKTEWIDEHATAARAKGATEKQVNQLRERLTVAANDARLFREHVLHVVHDDGRVETVEVGDVLANKERYHGLRVRDPLDPSYDGGRAVGKLFLLRQHTHPAIHSFAKGGQNHILSPAAAWVELRRGERHRITGQLLDALRREPDLYAHGDKVVSPTGLMMHTWNAEGFLSRIDGVASCFKWVKDKQDGVEVFRREFVDWPREYAGRILGLTPAERQLRELDAIVDTRLVRLDGSIIHKPGYDADLRVLADFDVDAPMPVDTPTAAQAADAVRALLAPFAQFPFASPVDRGVLLTALITAVLRPVLPTAPAFGFDASVQGSGKTLLARGVSALATGEPPALREPVRNDEEWPKTIGAILRGGTRVVVFDNVVGRLGSEAFAAMLTSPTYSTRTLGVSDAPTYAARTLWLLTGNNLSLSGDMPRRVLLCRVEPRMADPSRRRFDFDPVKMITADRHNLVADALTVVRFGVGLTKDERPNDSTASFEDWDRLIRVPVAVLGERHRDLGLDDPAVAMRDAIGADPETEALSDFLVALAERGWDTEWFTPGQLQKQLELSRHTFDDDGGALWEAFCCLIPDAGWRVVLSARYLANVLNHRKGRICGCRVLNSRTNSHSKRREFRAANLDLDAELGA